MPLAAPVTNATFPTKLPFALVAIACSCSRSRASLAVLLVRHLLQPVDGAAVELFLDGDVRHRGCRARPVPVLLAGWEPHDVAGADFLDRPAVALRPAAAADNDQGLAERMGVPRGACA